MKFYDYQDYRNQSLVVHPWRGGEEEKTHLF